MDFYRYETHTHTAEVSLCATLSAEDLVRFYKRKGFHGVFVTNHFLNGNTCVPREHGWRERIDMFCAGYEKAYEEGRKIGIDVFFGWEYSCRGTDLLTYGLDKDWLMKHPEVMEEDMSGYCDLVRSEGGFIVHAHPFREASYIDMIRLLPRKADGVEVLNGNCSDFENNMALEYARNYGLLQIAGSDTHHGTQKRLYGIRLKRPLIDARDMADALRRGEAEIFSE